MDLHKWQFPYTAGKQKTVAYFCMEYALDQSLKTYSGGLGFLAGTYMRAAYAEKLPVIGIGMLWRYGYYDQQRNEDRSMRVDYVTKRYTFLEDTFVNIPVEIHGHTVQVRVLYVRPDTFGTAPVFLLSTDIAENDYLSKTITQKLYDHEPSTRIAQNMVLGIAGTKLMKILGGADVYHFNETHALSGVFQLWQQHNGDTEAVKNKVVFTTHTPEKAANEDYDLKLLQDMGFLSNQSIQTYARYLEVNEGRLSFTPTMLKCSRTANGVSVLHGMVAREMWQHIQGSCSIKTVTNAQDARYWKDTVLYEAMHHGDDDRIIERKKEMKTALFREVADQCGKLFDKDTITIVWARRFAAYKRPDLLLRDIYRFYALLNNSDYPVQFIWAGKPYPRDKEGVALFNRLIELSELRSNFAVLTGYSLKLSSLLKKGADVWLNTPRIRREASGTSGMTAAMNGAVNVSTPDGWMPEFAKDRSNCFVSPPADYRQAAAAQDDFDHGHIMHMLEKEVLPAYYKEPARWVKIMKTAMVDVEKDFDGVRMAKEYYKKLYLLPVPENSE